MSARFSATGSRKSAVAKVWLVEGTGKLLINGRPANEYFRRPDLTESILVPLRVTQTLGQFDLRSRVAGGGVSAQAAAVSLGVARALVSFNPELRRPLKSALLLRRDPREKERMKYGLAKRRKRFQWTKR